MLTAVPLDPRTIIEFLAFLRVHVDTEPGDMNILGLQGMNLVSADPVALRIKSDLTPEQLQELREKYSKAEAISAYRTPILPVEISATPGSSVLKLNNNAPNVYNDVICVAFKTKAGLWDVRAYKGTVDPGDAYLNQPGGQAHLTFGQHMYVTGYHMGHPALRAQNEVNRVWRDKAKTGIYQHGDELSVGMFGVDVHAGGSGELINNWSAGCVNICGGWDGPDWKEFMGLVDTHFESKHAVGVTIWSGKDLCSYDTNINWPGGDPDWKPTLRFGMLNPWVAEMQQLLQAKNRYSGIAHGDWGDATQGAVEGFQHDMGLTEDGICGNAETWHALLEAT